VINMPSLSACLTIGTFIANTFTFFCIVRHLIFLGNKLRDLMDEIDEIKANIKHKL
jgi:uncharacterized protein with HEPN domain